MAMVRFVQGEGSAPRGTTDVVCTREIQVRICDYRLDDRKEGVLVEKVRLVADGRTYNDAGQTYSATPNREELLILMHIIAALDWDYAHVDESRALLNAPYFGENEAYVKFRGEKDYYKVLGALYGMKTAPRHYKNAVMKRLEDLGFKRLVMCSYIYFMRRGEDIVIVYDYVDDFIFTGSNRAVTEDVISEFRKLVTTAEEVWNADKILGMEFKRDRVKCHDRGCVRKAGDKTLQWRSAYQCQ